ncbi:MAG TPA: hypothetical protein VHT91_00275 [Kofleriaceae bacterium]|nr:hypothetical protein [Kofleriaceae bacterium]
MKLPPLFRDRPRAVQVMLGLIAPLAFGALCGYLLGASQPWFNGMMLLAGIGGIGAGFEHLGARDGARRGIVGGVLFAAALLVWFSLRARPALVPLPLPLPAMAVVYAVMGAPLGALGGRLRQRSEDRRAGSAA